MFIFINNYYIACKTPVSVFGSSLEKKSNLKARSKFIVSNFFNYSHFHDGCRIQVFRCRIFLERMLEVVLCDDKGISPHQHVSWVIFDYDSSGYRVLFLFLDFYLRDFVTVVHLSRTAEL
jgi:hypothetical protein